MVGEVSAVDRHRLVVFALFVLFAATAGIEPVEENLLPVDLVVVGLLFLRCGLDFDAFFLGLLFLVFLGLHHVEERVVQQLLFEMLLQVEQRHIEQIHRLVQAWIDLELLLELRVLGKTSFHVIDGSPSSAWENRERKRAVNVGPR